MIQTNPSWMNWSQRSAVGPIYHALRAGMVELDEYLGLRWPLSVLCFSSGKAGTTVEWLVRWDDLYALGREMLDLLSTPGFEAHFLQRDWPASSSALAAEIERQTSVAPTLAALTNDELLRAYDAFLARYRRWYALGWFAEPVLMCGHRMLGGAYEGVAGKLGIEVGEAKRRLSFVEVPTMGARLQAELLRLAAALRRAGLSEDASIGDLPEELQASLTTLAMRYYWAENDYYETVRRGPADLLRRTAQLLRDGVDPVAELENQRLAREKAAELRAQARALLPDYHRRLSDLLIRMAVLQDERKALIQQTNDVSDIFLSELGRRVGWALGDLRMLLPEELPELSHAPAELEAVVASRRQGCIIFWSRLPVGDVAVAGAGMDRALGGGELTPAAWKTPGPEIVQGAGECERMLTNLEERIHFSAEPSGRSYDALNGECVHLGSAGDVIRGVARVVLNPKDPGPFDKGDILVARSTTPDYVPLMHKAGAIITDWGGWASHAALVAREFDIPCVVDTGCASQVLDPGELIEVHLRESRIVRIRGAVRA